MYVGGLHVLQDLLGGVLDLVGDGDDGLDKEHAEEVQVVHSDAAGQPGGGLADEAQVVGRVAAGGVDTLEGDAPRPWGDGDAHAREAAAPAVFAREVEEHAHLLEDAVAVPVAVAPSVLPVEPPVLLHDRPEDAAQVLFIQLTAPSTLVNVPVADAAVLPVGPAVPLRDRPEDAVQVLFVQLTAPRTLINEPVADAAVLRRRAVPVGLHGAGDGEVVLSVREGAAAARAHQRGSVLEKDDPVRPDTGGNARSGAPEVADLVSLEEPVVRRDLVGSSWSGWGSRRERLAEGEVRSPGKCKSELLGRGPYELAKTATEKDALRTPKLS